MQGSSEVMLDERVAAALACLNAIEEGYRTQHQVICSMMKQHPSAVEQQQDKHIAALCDCLGLYAPPSAASAATTATTAPQTQPPAPPPALAPGKARRSSAGGDSGVRAYQPSRTTAEALPDQTTVPGQQSQPVEWLAVPGTGKSFGMKGPLLRVLMEADKAARMSAAQSQLQAGKTAESMAEAGQKSRPDSGSTGGAAGTAAPTRPPNASNKAPARASVNQGATAALASPAAAAAAAAAEQAAAEAAAVRALAFPEPPAPPRNALGAALCAVLSVPEMPLQEALASMQVGRVAMVIRARAHGAHRAW